MSEQAEPKARDLVMGGVGPPPVNGVVLGGVAGLKARFEQADIEQKRSILSETVQYGEKGLALLWRGLEDGDLKVRSQAYFLLKSAGVNSPKLEPGIPLRVGDRICGVYQSCVQYNEESLYPRYYIRHWVENHERFPFYRSDPARLTNGKIFEYVSDAPEYHPSYSVFGFCHPRLVCYCIEQTAAAESAKVAYNEKFRNLPCSVDELTNYPIGEFELNSVDLKAWVKAHDIKLSAEMPKNPSNADWEYYRCVLRSLQQQEQFDLLRELWELSKRRPLGLVHEYVIDRNCYLSFSKNQSY